ncbi:hypothetical protein [Niabella sp.]|uniref:hypothetical protein n=1 Tax=Niabella sp. TaxID=1962976 RepID=UPI0026376EB4|nr:hypothetical protein [Niabella sp.]
MRVKLNETVAEAFHNHINFIEQSVLFMELKYGPVCIDDRCGETGFLTVEKEM